MKGDIIKKGTPDSRPAWPRGSTVACIDYMARTVNIVIIKYSYCVSLVLYSDDDASAVGGTQDSTFPVCKIDERLYKNIVIYS